MVYSQPRNIFVKRDVKLTEPPDAEPHVRWCERSAAKAVSYSITETIGVEDEWQVPNLTESASVAEDGAVHITLTNLSLDKDYEIRTILTDYQVNEVKGEIVHGEMHEMNTFETPDQVRVKEFNEVEKTAEGIKFTIPKCSVLHLEVR